MAVVVLRWPEEEHEVERLSSQGIPHLLLVRPDAPAPARDDELEDWIRLPADDNDILARMNALERRASRKSAGPEVDGNGRVSHRGRWVTLSIIEREMMALLVTHFGGLVGAADLAQRGWPDRQPSSNAFRVHLTRLRHRIAPLGLKITNVRGVGFVLEEGREDSAHPTSRRWPE
ncbi:MAG TPA: helix-turn-helix domain-containing protein [Acidimicrobiales bacterium]